MATEKAGCYNCTAVVVCRSAFTIEETHEGNLDAQVKAWEEKALECPEYERKEQNDAPR